ncbi:AAA family ATPase [Acinetobacter sp. Marseille-Q1618]|uniref:AAA family ATPase n=1 Tax=Acinetobacter sp. Marseille-Q1618 TaxID=2697502 RepID=UPI00156F30BA|nr:AAA family ATPase [Acinetobacter sp. Marseille-Q1618]
MHINPDHYLETKRGRLWTVKRNTAAWQQCFADLDHALIHHSKNSDVYILIGCQASGKSTWAKQHLLKHPDDIVFDAILVKKSEREPILKLAKKYHKVCIAVCFQTPLKICLQRNQQRPQDQIVNENALTNVYKALEMPTDKEGFNQIIIINA